MATTPPDDIEATPGTEDTRVVFGLPRPVWLLGLTSLFTDTASEAIYPLLPLYLTRVLGAGAASLGLIEGFAEAANSLLKIVSGYLSDRWQTRRPIVIAGYSLSSAVRPLIALVSSWPQLFVVRFMDRVGKGVRGAPRDALLAACATPSTRGRIFGFHRAMDHVGAVAGPLLASLFLWVYPGRYRWLFALTIIPGALAVAMLFKVPKDQASDTATSSPGVRPTLVPPGWRGLPRSYFTLLAVLLVFALGNSADSFLLLRLTDEGVRPVFIPLLWALLHVVKALMSVWGGVKSDRWGRRFVIGSGWIVYALVYAGFAASNSVATLVTWFLVYGLYYGLSEGTEKALIADLAPADLRGTAFGIYNAALGIGSLLASVAFGLVWKMVSPTAAFGVGAVLAILATFMLFAFIREPRTV
ncbi:MAG TPA: MFS transporter [Vicinamibacterales bacterium]|jgi:MFS family permease